MFCLHDDAHLASYCAQMVFFNSTEGFTVACGKLKPSLLHLISQVSCCDPRHPILFSQRDKAKVHCEGKWCGWGGGGGTVEHLGYNYFLWAGTDTFAGDHDGSLQIASTTNDDLSAEGSEEASITSNVL